MEMYGFYFRFNLLDLSSSFVNNGNSFLCFLLVKLPQE